MSVKKVSYKAKGYRAALQQINSPPKVLFVAGELEELLSRPRVAVVGSRNVTTYGRNIITKLASDLAAQGIVIVSDLALGVDALAHQAALNAGALTLAVLPAQSKKSCRPATGIWHTPS